MLGPLIVAPLDVIQLGVRQVINYMRHTKNEIYSEVLNHPNCNVLEAGSEPNVDRIAESPV